MEFFIWADGTPRWNKGLLEKDESGNIISGFTASQFKYNVLEKREKLLTFY